MFWVVLQIWVQRYEKNMIFARVDAKKMQKLYKIFNFEPK